ncbi:hypothetical protein M514_00750 [Trichuris suis]|uniref:Uncharacterized protein n=1 Tax=Trichuris suis TaxID=68888 RepID=A0A085N9F7_9BILA|nr:hypothetical protein M513_00750 [Trichuris suis]KFD66103.1 hypothetical protein M514_00750 [Trichuris suis]
MTGSHRGFIAYLKQVAPEVNLLLQGDDLNLIRTEAVVCAFYSKLPLFKRKFARGEFLSFQIFVKWKEGKKFMTKTLKNIAITWNCCIGTSHSGFEVVINMQTADWMLNPFSAADNEELNLQEELIELQMNEKLKLLIKFNDLFKYPPANIQSPKS